MCDPSTPPHQVMDSFTPPVQALELLLLTRSSCGVTNIWKTISAGTNCHLFLSPLVGCHSKTVMPPPADIVKVAIEWPGANAQLIEMDQVRAGLMGDMSPIHVH